MTEKTRDGLKRRLQLLAEIYDREPVTRDAQELYCRVLSDLSLKQIDKGITLHQRDPKHGSYFPKPADIIRHIQPDEDESALKAWGAFVTACERFGAYDSVLFEDPALGSAIVDLGGWRNVSSWTQREEPFFMQRFVQAYKGNLGARESPRLVGINEANSRRSGTPVPATRVIGRSGQIEGESARRLLRSGDKTGDVLRRLKAESIGRFPGEEPVPKPKLSLVKLIPREISQGEALSRANEQRRRLAEAVREGRFASSKSQR